MSMSTGHIQRPETILFIGAGATSRLSMPTTDDQAGILWHLCDGDLTPRSVEKAASGSKCFNEIGDVIVDLLTVVDPGERRTDGCDLEDGLRNRAFPGINDEQVRIVVSELRQHYDWSALRLIAKTKKGDGYGEKDGKARENYLQEVFTLIDACLRESRGFYVYGKDNEQIFLSVARLTAARELLVLLINTMFACAWKHLVESRDGQERLCGYRKFFDSLAKLMQQEGISLSNSGVKEVSAEFYKLSYSIITTNFEPMFLWFVWQGHLHANKSTEVRVGNPGRMLKLLMNFPTTVGMRKPADPGEDLETSVWLPCTEAVAQNVNKTSYLGNRTFRLGMYSPVHGMSTFRHCPVCGRLNLYLGDSWDENATMLFPNGLIEKLKFGQRPRTEAEKGAWDRGEYDALSCQFCGSLTRSYDNFMFMQTQLKSASPSFGSRGIVHSWSYTINGWKKSPSGGSYGGEPYQRAFGLSLEDQKLVKKIRACLKSLSKKRSNISWKRDVLPEIDAVRYLREDKDRIAEWCRTEVFNGEDWDIFARGEDDVFFAKDGGARL